MASGVIFQTQITHWPTSKNKWDKMKLQNNHLCAGFDTLFSFLFTNPLYFDSKYFTWFVSCVFCPDRSQKSQEKPGSTYTLLRSVCNRTQGLVEDFAVPCLREHQWVQKIFKLQVSFLKHISHIDITHLLKDNDRNWDWAWCHGCLPLPLTSQSSCTGWATQDVVSHSTQVHRETWRKQKQYPSRS